MASATLELERLIVRLVGDSTAYVKMLEQASGKTTQATQKMSADFQRMATAIAVPLMAVGALGVKSFADFDQAMTETFAKMGKQTPQVRKEMEDVAKALSMSGDVAFSPTELARGYEELASAGLNAERSMAALSTTAKFAQAGAFDMKVAVKQLTGAMASFGLTTQTTTSEQFAKEMGHFSDVIVGVANETTTGVEQVARAMSADAAVAAKGYGASLEELGAILGVFALQNKDAEEAGNLTGRAFRLMSSSFVDNMEVWKSLGVDIVNDTTGEFIKFADAIELLENSFAGLTGPQKIAQMNMMGMETLSQKAILPLIGQSKELRRQEELYKKHGTTLTMARTQMESFTNQLKVMWNTITVTAIEIGGMLTPSLTFLAGKIKDVMKWFQSLSPTIKQVIVRSAALVAGIISVVAAIGMLGITGSMVGMVVFIAGVAAAIVYLEATTDILSRAWKALGVIATKVWAAITKVVSDLWEELKPVGRAISELVALIGEEFQKFIDEVGPDLAALWADVSKDALEAWNWLAPVRQAIFDFVVMAIKSFGNLIRKVFAFGKSVVKTISAMYTYISTTWKNIETLTGTSWGTIRNTIIDAIIGAEFALENFSRLWAYVGVSARLAIAEVAAEVKHLFMVALPLYLKWVQQNLGNAFVDALKLVSVAFGNLMGDLVHNSALLTYNMGVVLNAGWTTIYTSAVSVFNNLMMEIGNTVIRGFTWLVNAGPALLDQMWAAISTAGRVAIGELVGNAVKSLVAIPEIANNQTNFNKLWEKTLAHGRAKDLKVPDFSDKDAKSGVKEAVKGISKELDEQLMKFKWTPLTKGFETSLTDLPTIPKREIEGVEKQLKDEQTRLGKELSDDWTSFREGKLRQFAEGDWDQWEMDNIVVKPDIEMDWQQWEMDNLVTGGVEAGGEAGKLIGKTMGKAVDKELEKYTPTEKFEAVLKGSAEGLARMLDSRARLFGRKEMVNDAPYSDPFKGFKRVGSEQPRGDMPGGNPVGGKSSNPFKDFELPPIKMPVIHPSDLPEINVPKVVIDTPEVKIPKLKPIETPKIGDVAVDPINAPKIPDIKTPKVEIATPEMPKIDMPKSPIMKDGAGVGSFAEGFDKSTIPDFAGNKIKAPKLSTIETPKIEGINVGKIDSLESMFLPKINVKDIRLENQFDTPDVKIPDSRDIKAPMMPTVPTVPKFKALENKFIEDMPKKVPFPRKVPLPLDNEFKPEKKPEIGFKPGVPVSGVEQERVVDLLGDILRELQISNKKQPLGKGNLK